MTDAELYFRQYVKEKGTIRENHLLATNYLAQAGVEEARENSELLLQYLLVLDKAQLLLSWHDAFPQDKYPSWYEWLQRKASGEPIQYITQEAWFYSRSFEVGPAVLIPRPETELLVEAVLQAVEEQWTDAEYSPIVLDVGTGSGAISVTLQAEMPRLTVIASDISEAALQMARSNAKQQEVEHRMHFVQGDLLEPFVREGRIVYDGKSIDVLVSNPPYIPIKDMVGLQREVKDYEPHLALVGGEDGLDPYRMMLARLEPLERKPAIVAFELGIHQPAIIVEQMNNMDYWTEIKVITDYNGIDRHIIAIKR